MDITYTTLLAVNSAAAEALGRSQEKRGLPNSWRQYFQLAHRPDIKHKWVQDGKFHYFRKQDLSRTERAFLAGYKASREGCIYPLNGIAFHAHLTRDAQLLDLLAAIGYNFSLRNVTEEGEVDVLVEVNHSVAQFWQALNGVEGFVPQVTILPSRQEAVQEEFEDDGQEEEDEGEY